MVMTCVTGIQQGWDEGDLFKLTISGIARHFRNADETARQALLATRPPLTCRECAVALWGHAILLSQHDLSRRGRPAQAIRRLERGVAWPCDGAILRRSAGSAGRRSSAGSTSIWRSAEMARR